MIGPGSQGNIIDTYLGGDTLPKVAERIRNLLAGREFAVAHYIAGAGTPGLPRTLNAVALADRDAPFAVTQRPAPGRDDFRTEYRVVATFEPAPDTLDLITHYDTAREAQQALMSGEHQDDRLAVTRVIVRGGGVPSDAQPNSSVTVVTTNGYGATSILSLTPRWVPFAARVAAEAEFFDALADLLDADAAAMNAAAARAAAARVRVSAKSEFTGQVMAA
jgi:hypothetical protein